MEAQRGQTIHVNASIRSIKHTFPPSDGNTGISDIWSCLNSYIAYGCFPGS